METRDDGTEVEHLVNKDAMDVLENALRSIPIGRYTVWLAFVFSLANAADAVELMCVSYLIPSAACAMHMGPGRKGLLSSISFIGMMIGGLVGGYSADKWGRRRSLCSALLLNGAAGLASALQVSYALLVVFRLFAAVGVGGSIPVVWTYFAEFLPTWHRGLFLTVVSSSWMLGSIVSASLALLLIPLSATYGWRYFTVASSAPAFLAYALVRLIPESPKYLTLKQDHEQCWRTLETLWRRNTSAAFELSYKEDFLKSVPHQEPQGKSAALLIFTRDNSLIPLRNQLLVLACVTGLLCYGYYGVLMWMPDLLTGLGNDSWSSGICTTRGHNNTAPYPECIPSESVYIDSILIAVSSFPGNLFSLLFIDKIGRRWLLIPSLFGTGMAVVSIPFVKKRFAAVIFACIFSCISVIPFNALNCIGTELFPTEFRSNAFGIQYVFGRIGAVCATATFGYLLKLYCALPLIIVAGNFFLAGFLSLSLKETSNVEIF